MSDLASFGTRRVRQRACVARVSVSAEAKSCRECVHTCSQMNEAVGSELSGDIGSCQRCGVCDL